MKATNTTYDLTRSLQRIDEILDADNKSFEELDHIPTRDKLTYKNGFTSTVQLYLWISAEAVI